MATSKLQRLCGDLLDKEFPQFRIRENYKPDWLLSSKSTKLELDFYIEDIKIAFEIQGAQHYQFVPFFHKDISDFEKRKKFDEEKRDLCYGNGVKLIEIFTETDIRIAIADIKTKYCKLPKYEYSYSGKVEKPSRQPSKVLLQYVKLAKRAISRKRESKLILQRVWDVFGRSEVEGFEVTDRDILEVYAKNKEIIDDRKFCEVCKDQRFFTKKGYMEHMQSKHI